MTTENVPETGQQHGNGGCRTSQVRVLLRRTPAGHGSKVAALYALTTPRPKKPFFFLSPLQTWISLSPRRSYAYARGDGQGFGHGGRGLRNERRATISVKRDDAATHAHAVSCTVPGVRCDAFGA